MKFSILAVASTAAAFPTMVAEKLKTRQAGNNVVNPLHPVLTFNAAQQYVSTSGKYAFVAPGPNDIRGPCPGLNAAANHGYIPHNGVATIPEFIEGTFQAYGMAVDLSTFLAVFGAVFDGNGYAWSIGGPAGPANGVAISGDGLTGSHNKYEADVSPSRGDLYETGDNYHVNLTQFEGLYALQADETEETSNYNLEILQQYRATRFQQSIDQNPYFFNGPFSGVAVQPAAYTFIYRFMANKSEEHPDGRLSKSVLRSFFSINEAEDGTLSYTPGNERIPDNWYKRAIGDEYTIPFFVEDLIQEATVYPQFINVGGNTGKVNTFTPLNIEDLTGGVYNTSTLLEGNNLQCFLFQIVQSFAPDPIVGLADTLLNGLNLLHNSIVNATENLGCPQLANVNYNLMDTYPGYRKSGSVL